MVKSNYCNTAAGATSGPATDQIDFSQSTPATVAGEASASEENNSTLCVNTVSIVELNVDKHCEWMHVVCSIARFKSSWWDYPHKNYCESIICTVYI